MTYILEGAVARSEAAAKLAAIESALTHMQEELGERPPLTPPMPTKGHLAFLDEKERASVEEEAAKLQHQASDSVSF